MKWLAYIVLVWLFRDELSCSWWIFWWLAVGVAEMARDPTVREIVHHAKTGSP